MKTYLLKIIENIYHLKKYSLITYKTSSSYDLDSTFSIHRSIHCTYLIEGKNMKNNRNSIVLQSQTRTADFPKCPTSIELDIQDLVKWGFNYFLHAIYSIISESNMPQWKKDVPLIRQVMENAQNEFTSEELNSIFQFTANYIYQGKVPYQIIHLFLKYVVLPELKFDLKIFIEDDN